MKNAREIAVLSASFTAGIASGMSTSAITAGQVSPTSLYLAASISLALIILSIFFLLIRKEARSIDIIILYILTGIFCWFSGELSGIGVPKRNEWIWYRATAHVKSVIDSIPFSNPDTAGLIRALITGDKSDMDKSVIRAFRDSGASHILALSGLHLGIIYAILLKFTSIIGNSPAARKIRSTAIIMASGFYTLATGASASLVRAFLFILLNETAKMLHRKTEPAGIFCCALMIQLAVIPSAITSAGFQLSYMAMAGIFFLLPALKSWYPADSDEGQATGSKAVSGIARKMWNAAAMTIACQIFTGPLAWYHFHTFPTYFLITNLLALPVTTILMTIAVATVGLYYLGICPSILILATDKVANILIFIMETVSSM